MKKLLLTLSLMALCVIGFAQDSVTVTINLSMSQTTVDPGGVYIAGGSAFGPPSDNPAYELTDPDGDDVYTVVLTVERNSFSSFYTFANGACPDYSCKENIAGQPCADPNNFNDRFLPTVTQDTTINTCFGECTDDLNCSAPSDPVNVTFAVDMNDADSISANGLIIGGQVETPNWQFATPMTDPQGDGIWTVTLTLAPGQYEYKYANGGAAAQESFPPDSLDCTLTTGEFTNRLIEVPSEDILVGPYVYNSCEILRDTSGNLVGTFVEQVAPETLFDVAPTVISRSAQVTFAADLRSEKQLSLLNLNGQTVRSTKIGAAEQSTSISVEGLANGLYFVRVQAGDRVATRKVMIRR